MSEFIINRSQQFIDLIFGAIIVSTTDFNEFKKNMKNSAESLLILITNAVYFRLIILTTVSLVIETLDVTYDDAIVIMAQYLYTLLITTFYVESFKSVMFSNIVLVCSFSVQLIQLDNFVTGLLGTSTLLSFSLFVLTYTKKDLETSQVNTTIATQNKMGEILMTAFQNSLPTKILPQILKAENPPCEIVNNVNFCYMYFRPPELQTKYGIQQQYEVYLSKINQFFCILDFFSDIMDIQKIKSSHMYYMCCTGAQQQLNKDVSLAECNYPNQYDSSKLLITFCIIAQEIAEMMDINCSCGITKGDVIVGAISMSTSIINFDTYGDTINTAARIARNNVNGVFIYLNQFKDQEFTDEIHQNTNQDDDENELNLNYIDYSKFKTIFLKAPPQYYFTKAVKREYKGKGIVCVHQVQANSQLQSYACQAFQRAYLLLASDFLQKNMQAHEGMQISHMEQDLDDSMLESSESFIDSDATSNDGEISTSNDIFVVEDSILEDQNVENSTKQLKIMRGEKLEKNIYKHTQRLINIQCQDFYQKLSQQTQNNYQYQLKNQNQGVVVQTQYSQNQNQFYLHSTVNANIIKERIQSFDIQRLLQPDNQPMLSISHKLKRNSSSRLKNLLSKENQPNPSSEYPGLQRMKSEKLADIKKQYVKASNSSRGHMRGSDEKFSDLHGYLTPRDRDHKSNNKSEISGRSIDSGSVNPQMTARKYTFGLEQSGKVYLNKDLHNFFTIARQTNEKKFFSSRTEYTNMGSATGHDSGTNRFLRQLNEDENELHESGILKNQTSITSVTSTKNKSINESSSKKAVTPKVFPMIREQSSENLQSQSQQQSQQMRRLSKYGTKDENSEAADVITELSKLPPLDFTKLNQQNQSQMDGVSKKVLGSKTLDTSQLVSLIQQPSVLPHDINISKTGMTGFQKGFQQHIDQQPAMQTSKMPQDILDIHNGSKLGGGNQQEQTIFQKQIQQLKQMGMFLLNYSQLYVEGIHDNQELLEIWYRNFSIRYQLYQLLQFVILSGTIYLFFIHNEYRIRVLNILFRFSELYGNICVIMIILMLVVLFFQVNYCAQVKQEIALQKKQYNHDSLDKLLNGQFAKFQQVYLVLIVFLQHAKIFVDAKLLYTYKTVELFVPQQMHYTIILILDVIMLFSLIINHIWYQVVNIQIISHSYKVIWAFFLIFAILHAFMIKIITLVMLFSMIMLTIYTYPSMKSFYTNCAVEIQLKDQLNNGKALLKNILPQITIDALLSNSQNNDTIIIENNVYKLFKLKSIQQLLDQNSLPIFNKQLNNVVYYDELTGTTQGTLFGGPNNQDSQEGAGRQHQVMQSYYNFRFCQLLFKYSKLPNRRSFGSDRPVINFGEVAYLNLDVSQFTSFCSSHKVDQIQQLLKKLFGRFDNRMKLCKNIIQVKICGDSYELMSLPLILKQYKSRVNLDKNKLTQLKNYDAVNQLIFLGLGFIEDCKSVLQKYFPDEVEKLGLRVGISFGEVLGSLLGNKITRFDTFGMVPILAEEAQSNASRNSIMIDKSAWNVLNNNSSVLKDYVIDFVTTETMKNNYANYNEEVVDFELIENEYGVGIKGIK